MTIFDSLPEETKRDLEQFPLSHEYKEILKILFQARECPNCNSIAKMYIIGRRKSKFGFMIICDKCGLQTKHIHTNLKLMVEDWNEVCEEAT